MRDGETPREYELRLECAKLVSKLASARQDRSYALSRTRALHAQVREDQDVLEGLLGWIESEARTGTWVDCPWCPCAILSNLHRPACPIGRAQRATDHTVAEEAACPAPTFPAPTSSAPH